VIALPGVYNGGVVLNKTLDLRGLGAVIDASSSATGNGVEIVGPGGSGSSVERFKIMNAKLSAATSPTETVSGAGRSTSTSPAT
jgi:hypothetical protein